MDLLSSVPVDPWIVLFGAFLVFFLLIVPFFVNLLGGWRKSRDAVNSPMTVTLHTEKTPAQLNSAARFDRFKRNLLWVGAFVFMWALLHIINPDLAVSVDEIVFGAIGAAFGLLSQAFAAVGDLFGSYS